MKISISSNLNQFILPKFFFLHLLIYFVYEGGGTCGSQKTTDGTPSTENIYIGITRINNRFTARERNQDKWHIDTLKFSSQLPLSHTKIESIQRCIYRCMYFVCISIQTAVQLLSFILKLSSFEFSREKNWVTWLFCSKYSWSFITCGEKELWDHAHNHPEETKQFLFP